MLERPAAFFRTPRRLLLIVFAAALLPRLWSLGWGMPLKAGNIDEAVVVFYSLRVASGDPNPAGFYDYPGFFLYALAALFKGTLAAVRLCGWPVPPDAEAWDAYMRGDGLIFLLAVARLLNAALGAATAVVLFRMGRARWGAFAGAGAALLWAANPLAVAQAHYATVDTPTAFLVLLAAERMLLHAEAGGRREALWAAFLTGLAAATKYFPAVLGLFLLPLPFLRGARRPWRTAALLALVMAGTFAACNPYMIIDARVFFERFLHLFPKIVGGGGAREPFLLPTLKGLWDHAGPAALLAAAAGLAALFRSARRGDVLLASMAVFLLLFLGAWRLQLPRYALALYPLLFLAAARGLALTSRWGRLFPAAGLLLSVGIVAPRTYSYLARISRPDTRLQALAWAREALPAGTRVLRFARTPEFSPRDPFAVSVDWKNERLPAVAAGASVDEFDVLIHGTYDPADPQSAALAARFELVKRFDDPPPFNPHDPVVSVYRARRP